MTLRRWQVSYYTKDTSGSNNKRGGLVQDNLNYWNTIDCPPSPMTINKAIKVKKIIHQLLYFGNPVPPVTLLYNYISISLFLQAIYSIIPGSYLATIVNIHRSNLDRQDDNP